MILIRFNIRFAENQKIIRISTNLLQFSELLLTGPELFKSVKNTLFCIQCYFYNFQVTHCKHNFVINS